MACARHLDTTGAPSDAGVVPTSIFRMCFGLFRQQDYVVNIMVSGGQCIWESIWRLGYDAVAYIQTFVYAGVVYVIDDMYMMSFTFRWAAQKPDTAADTVARHSCLTQSTDTVA